MVIELLLLIVVIILTMLIAADHTKRDVNVILGKLSNMGIVVVAEIFGQYKIPKLREAKIGETSHTVITGHGTVSTAVIFMCVRNGNKMYDWNTLARAYLHEYAHTLTSELGHNETFLKYEALLVEKAVELGYIDVNIDVDSSYPCH